MSVWGCTHARRMTTVVTVAFARCRGARLRRMSHTRPPDPLDLLFVDARVLCHAARYDHRSDSHHVLSIPRPWACVWSVGRGLPMQVTPSSYPEHAGGGCPTRYLHATLAMCNTVLSTGALPGHWLMLSESCERLGRRRAGSEHQCQPWSFGRTQGGRAVQASGENIPLLIVAQPLAQPHPLCYERTHSISTNTIRTRAASTCLSARLQSYGGSARGLNLSTLGRHLRRARSSRRGMSRRREESRMITQHRNSSRPSRCTRTSSTGRRTLGRRRRRRHRARGREGAARSTAQRGAPVG